MISWPGVIPAGETRHQFATGNDWLPTWRTFSISTSVHLGSMDTACCRFWGTPGSSRPTNTMLWDLAGRAAIRDGAWKLLIRPLDTTERHDPGELPARDQQFLVNLESDPSEINNLALRHPEIVERLLEILRKRRTEY